jgi:hypothetical protein
MSRGGSLAQLALRQSRSGNPRRTSCRQKERCSELVPLRQVQASALPSALPGGTGGFNLSTQSLSFSSAGVDCSGRICCTTCLDNGHSARCSLARAHRRFASVRAVAIRQRGAKSPRALIHIWTSRRVGSLASCSGISSGTAGTELSGISSSGRSGRCHHTAPCCWLCISQPPQTNMPRRARPPTVAAHWRELPASSPRLSGRGHQHRSSGWHVKCTRAAAFRGPMIARARAAERVARRAASRQCRVQREIACLFHPVAHCQARIA